MNWWNLKSGSWHELHLSIFILLLIVLHIYVAHIVSLQCLTFFLYVFLLWLSGNIYILISLLPFLSHYASCLEYLGNLKANLLLDIHLHDHVETLYDQIRHKALIQYTLPFVSVDLNMMANAFKTTVAGLEKELEALITDNQIQVWFHLICLVLSIAWFGWIYNGKKSTPQYYIRFIFLL